MISFSLDNPSYALIEGSLCRLNRKGNVVKRHAPMGWAVEEFLVLEDRILVRESGDGVLQGMTNLYCLDENLHLLWLADAPEGNDVYAGPLTLIDGRLSCPTGGGRCASLSLTDGLPADGAAHALQNT